MANYLTPNAKQRFFDANGNPLAGGKLYTYLAGTTTLATTYVAQSGAANTNPIVLDANGECNVWIVEGSAYKFVLKDALETTTYWTVDNISLQSFESDSVSVKTTTYTAVDSDDIILAQTASAWTLGIYTAVGNAGKKLRVIKTSSDTNDLTLDPNGSETINGFSTVKLSRQYDEITIISDGSNWVMASQTKSPTVQKFTSGSGTYTTPLGVKHLRVRMVGGGGGGAGGGSSGGTSGGNGVATTFGTSLLRANEGAASVFNSAIPTLGGTASLGTGPVGIAIQGASGNPQVITSIANVYGSGGSGGVTPFGGSGAGGSSGGNASAGVANTGSGGGGGSGGSGLSGANGGAAGGYIDAIIYNPLATYAYAVGAGGAAGSAGTSSGAGGAGGSGFIIVEEFYS